MLVRNQKGSILLVVFVAMLTLVLLGTALAGMSIYDQRQAVRQQKNSEAMYLARGGAEAVAAHLLKYPQDAPKIIALGCDEVVLDNGAKFVVEVTEDEDGRLFINSTGYSGENMEKLTFSLEPSPELVIPDAEVKFPVFDMAVFAEGLIAIGNSSIINGNLGTHSILDDNVFLNNSSAVHGNVMVGVGGNTDRVISRKNNSIITGICSSLDEERSYPLPIFPEFPNLPQRGDLIADSTTPIATSGSYGKITVNNGQELMFNVGSEGLKIRAESFNIGNSSKVTINGSGKLILYIENTFDIKNSSTFNFPGNPNNVLLYFKGDSSKFKIRNSCVFHGCLYAETADIDLANSGEVVGSIFTGGADVKLSNCSDAYVRVIYAPNALVTLHNSGNLKGAVVCKQFDSKNSSTLTFSSELEGIWNVVPDIDFEEEEVEPELMMKYITGSWSN